LDTLQSKGHGITIIAPISLQNVSFVGYSFVDDNDIIQIDGDSPQNTAQKLQLAVDTWEGGLKVTGGALGPDKSYWYLVSFKWTGGRWSYSSITDNPAVLYMNDINKTQKTVRCIPTHQAQETLGVWISPNGCTKTQTEKMIEKANLWADHMCTGVITKAETWLALNSTIWRTFSYPLNALNLSKKQRSCLQSDKLCRFRNKHIYTLQEIARLKDILQHTYDNTTAGKLYRTSLEHLILEIGISMDLSYIDYSKYHILATDCLVKNTWKFLYTHNITLEHDITVPKNITHDLPIMYELSTNHPSVAELETLNQCRIFLQAYYISDIAAASGTRLSRHAWEGTPRIMGKTSRYLWPQQGMPSKQEGKYGEDF
jgi:hypothetical protein